MLGRQGALLAQRGGDRQPAQERRHRYREDDGERQMTDQARKPEVRRRKPRVSNLAAAVMAIVLIVVACYLVFGGGLPFGSSRFELKAAFTANTDLHIPSPVRIAGVQVGEVTGVERIKDSPNAGIVVMQIDKNGLPIHAD